MTRFTLLAAALIIACRAQSASAQFNPRPNEWFRDMTGLGTSRAIPQPTKPFNDGGSHFGDPEVRNPPASLNFWRTPERHTFQRVQGGWIEYDSRGVIHYRFREVSYNGTTAYLQDDSRNLCVLLTPQQAYWGQPGGHPWHFMYGRVY